MNGGSYNGSSYVGDKVEDLAKQMQGLMKIVNKTDDSINDAFNKKRQLKIDTSDLDKVENKLDVLNEKLNGQNKDKVVSYKVKPNTETINYYRSQSEALEQLIEATKKYKKEEKKGSNGRTKITRTGGTDVKAWGDAYIAQRPTNQSISDAINSMPKEVRDIYNEVLDITSSSVEKMEETFKSIDVLPNNLKNEVKEIVSNIAEIPKAVEKAQRSARKPKDSLLVGWDTYKKRGDFSDLFDTKVVQNRIKELRNSLKNIDIKTLTQGQLESAAKDFNELSDIFADAGKELPKEFNAIFDRIINSDKAKNFKKYTSVLKTTGYDIQNIVDKKKLLNENYAYRTGAVYKKAFEEIKLEHEKPVSSGSTEYIKKTDQELYESAMSMSQNREKVLEEMAQREIDIANKLSGDEKKVYRDMAIATFDMSKRNENIYEIQDKFKNTNILIGELQDRLKQESDPKAIQLLNEQLDSAIVNFLTLEEVYGDSLQFNKGQLNYNIPFDVIETYARKQREMFSVGESSFNIASHNKEYLQELTKDISTEEELKEAIERRKEALVEATLENERLNEITNAAREKYESIPYSERDKKKQAELAYQNAFDNEMLSSEKYNEIEKEYIVLTQLQENWGKSVTETSQIVVEYLESEYMEFDRITLSISNMVREIINARKSISQSNETKLSSGTTAPIVDGQTEFNTQIERSIQLEDTLGRKLDDNSSKLFANSAMIDEQNGKLNVLFHGSPNNFNEFNKDKMKPGLFGTAAYFDLSKQQAENYAGNNGVVYQYFTKAANLFRTDSELSREQLELIFNEYKDFLKDKYYDLDSFINDWTNNGITNLNGIATTLGVDFQDMLSKLGYAGSFDPTTGIVAISDLSTLVRCNKALFEQADAIHQVVEAKSKVDSQSDEIDISSNTEQQISENEKLAGSANNATQAEEKLHEEEKHSPAPDTSEEEHLDNISEKAKKATKEEKKLHSEQNVSTSLDDSTENALEDLKKQAENTRKEYQKLRINIEEVFDFDKRYREYLSRGENDVVAYYKTISDENAFYFKKQSEKDSIKSQKGYSDYDNNYGRPWSYIRRLNKEQVQTIKYTWEPVKDNDGNDLFDKDGKLVTILHKNYGDVLTGYQQVENAILSADNKAAELERKLESNRRILGENYSGKDGLEKEIEIAHNEASELFEVLKEVYTVDDKYDYTKIEEFEEKRAKNNERLLAIKKEQQNVDEAKAQNRIDAKIEADAKKEQQNIQKTNRLLSSRENILNHIVRTYDKVANPDLEKYVSNNDDLIELNNKKIEIENIISKLKGKIRNERNEKDFLLLEKEISLYKDMAKYKLKTNNPTTSELSGVDLRTAISTKISDYDKLIARAKKYGELTKDLVNNLKNKRNKLSEVDINGNFKSTNSDYLNARSDYKIEAASFSALEPYLKEQRNAEKQAARERERALQEEQKIRRAIAKDQQDTQIKLNKEQERSVNKYYRETISALNKVKQLKRELSTTSFDSSRRKDLKNQIKAQFQRANYRTNMYGDLFSREQNLAIRDARTEIENLNAKIKENIKLRSNAISKDRFTESFDRYKNALNNYSKAKIAYDKNKTQENLVLLKQAKAERKESAYNYFLKKYNYNDKFYASQLDKEISIIKKNNKERERAILDDIDANNNKKTSELGESYYNKQISNLEKIHKLESDNIKLSKDSSSLTIKERDAQIAKNNENIRLLEKENAELIQLRKNINYTDANKEDEIREQITLNEELIRAKSDAVNIDNTNRARNQNLDSQGLQYSVSLKSNELANLEKQMLELYTDTKRVNNQIQILTDELSNVSDNKSLRVFNKHIQLIKSDLQEDVSIQKHLNEATSDYISSIDKYNTKKSNLFANKSVLSNTDKDDLKQLRTRMLEAKKIFEDVFSKALNKGINTYGSISDVDSAKQRAAEQFKAAAKDRSANDATKENNIAIKSYEELSKKAKRYYELRNKQVKNNGLLNPQDTKELNELSDAFERAFKAEEEFAKTRMKGAANSDDYDIARYNFIKNNDSAFKNSINDWVNKSVDKLKELGESGKYVDGLVAEINDLQSKLNNIDITNIDITDKTQLIDILDYIDKIKKELSTTLASTEDPFKIKGSIKDVTDLRQQIAKTLKDNSAMSSKFKSRFKELGKELKNATSPTQGQINEWKTTFSKIEAEMLEAGRTGKSTFSYMSDQIKSANAQLLRMYFSWMDWIRYARQGITVVKEYNDALTKMSYTMDLSKHQLDELGKSAIEQSKALGTSIQNMEQIYQIYANMNTTAEEINQLSKPTAILSNLSGADASTAADQVQGIIQQFNMLEDASVDAADASMHVVDVLDKISANVAIDYSKGINVITEAVTATGQAAYDAGMSYEQLGAISAKIAERTREDGSSIGNAIKTMLVRISKVSKMPGYEDEVDPETINKAAESLNEVGIKVYDSQGNFRDITDILTELNDVWDDLTDAQQNNISFQVAATRQSSKFKNMLTAWTDAMNLATEATEANGNAEINNEKYLDSYSGKIQLIKNELQSLAIELLDSDMFSHILDDIRELIVNVTKFGTSAIPTIELITDTFRGLLSILNPIIKGVSKISEAFSKFGTAGNVAFVGLTVLSKNLIKNFGRPKCLVL